MRLGFTALGGPAAHIAIMHDEVVKRCKWLTDEHFLDLLAATNLISGLNSTEMAIRIGDVRAGWLLYGIKPVVMAIIIQAMWVIGSKALKTYGLIGRHKERSL